MSNAKKRDAKRNNSKKNKSKRNKARKPNPHDVLFKKTFSKVENAKGLLRVNLPKSFVDKANWDTLNLAAVLEFAD